MAHKVDPAPRYFVVEPWQGCDGATYPGFDDAIVRRIRERGMTKRAAHTLVAAGIKTMEQLASMGLADFARIKDCGKKTISELMAFRSVAVLRGGIQVGVSDAYGAGFADGWRMALRKVREAIDGRPPTVVVPAEFGGESPGRVQE